MDIIFEGAKQSLFLVGREAIFKLLNEKNKELSHLLLVLKVPQQAFLEREELPISDLTVSEEELKELNNERIMTIVKSNHKL